MPKEEEKKTEQELEREKKCAEGMDLWDYFWGILFMILSMVALALLAWYYWNLHGGSIDKFAFWDTGDKKWLEVLFWASFTCLAEHLGRASYWMAEKGFQKRDALKYIGTTLEAPIIAFALVFVVFNLGVSFGESSVSLKNVPMTVVIAFAIVSAYTAGDTRLSILHVGKWLRDRVETKLTIKPGASRHNVK